MPATFRRRFSVLLAMREPPAAAGQRGHEFEMRKSAAGGMWQELAFTRMSSHDHRTDHDS